MSATAIVFSNGDRDACVTVVNSGKSTVELAVFSATTSTINVSSGDSAGLCTLALDQVELTCVGLTACSAQWRVDDN